MPFQTRYGIFFADYFVMCIFLCTFASNLDTNVKQNVI